ncbi:MAG: 16S rRNA (cytosine(1402)-N(4))-methyltransferase, partial [Phycisphaerae bacterium]
RQRITTTRQLSDIVCRAVGVKDPNSRRSKIHPATRVFQALRMAVNDEMGALESFLKSIPSILAPGGRAAVIAFHSVEDKLVKTEFREGKINGVFRLITKKPVVAEEEERLRNPRSRSAKLRVVELIDQEANGGSTG